MTAIKQVARTLYRQAPGAMARLSEEKALSALRIPSRGMIYDLGLEISERMPQGTRGVNVPFSIAFTATPTGTRRVGAFQYALEVIVGSLHTSTHLDALNHVQADGKVYGGRSASEIFTDKGWLEMGVETVPPIIGRCVLLDVAGYKDVEMLPDTYEITATDLETFCRDRAVTIGSGDIVLIRTGKILQFLTDPAAFLSSQAGIGPTAALWLYEQGMSVLGTDTAGTEPLPFRDPANTTHRAMLVESGVCLLENLYLDDLAHDGVVQALFICLPLKIVGATGSWVRPVAFV